MLDLPKPTKKDQEILFFIHQYRCKHNVSPIIREIMVYFGYTSTSTVQTRLDRLVKQGWLQRRDRGYRAIDFTHKIGTVPIIGTCN